MSGIYGRRTTLHCVLGLAVSNKLRWDEGLREIVSKIQQALGGQWGRKDGLGKLSPDPHLTLEDVFTASPFYGDYRKWWERGETRECSENWQIHLIGCAGRHHFLTINRCGALPYNDLVIAADLPVPEGVSSYQELAASLYALAEPWFVFVDAPQSLPDRKTYEGRQVPMFWCNWYCPDLVSAAGGKQLLLEVPAYEVKEIPSGGVYLQVTPSLYEHVREGWNNQLKRHFRGKRIRWASY